MNYYIYRKELHNIVGELLRKIPYESQSTNHLQIQVQYRRINLIFRSIDHTFTSFSLSLYHLMKIISAINPRSIKI